MPDTRRGEAMRTYTPFVCKSSFLEGAGRVLDFWGIFPPAYIEMNPAEADALAMYSDWLAVGQDLSAAMVFWEQTSNAREESPRHVHTEQPSPAEVEHAGGATA